MHNNAMWPMHGKYICPDCLREHPVAWEGIPRATETAAPPSPPALLQLFGRLKRFGTM
jgi:hypothetical protein